MSDQNALIQKLSGMASLSDMAIRRTMGHLRDLDIIHMIWFTGGLDTEFSRKILTNVSKDWIRMCIDDYEEAVPDFENNIVGDHKWAEESIQSREDAKRHFVENYLAKIAGRILDLAENFKNAADLPVPKPIQKQPDKPDPDAEFLRKVTSELAPKGLLEMTEADLIAFLVAAAQLARRSGVISLDFLQNVSGSIVIREGIRLVTDGVAPAVVTGSLQRHVDLIIMETTIKTGMLTDGMNMILDGYFSNAIREQLRPFVFSTEEKVPDDVENFISKYLTDLTRVQLLEWIARTNRHVRTNKLETLNRWLDRIRDPLIGRFVRILILKTVPETARSILQNSIQTCLRTLQTRLHIAHAGLLAIEHGENPKIVEKRLKAYV